MTESAAEKAILTSALMVAAIYAYRLLTEGSSPTTGKMGALTGQGSPPPIGTFITAWGATFLVLAVITEISPSLGGSFAILVAAGDFIGNSAQVAKDVQTKIGAAPAAAKAPSMNPKNAQQATALANSAGIPGTFSALTPVAHP